MIAQEKAKDLFCKMYGCEINADLKDIYISNADGFFIAKDCAIISVDEMISLFESLFISEGSALHQYLLEVKKEIEKL